MHAGMSREKWVPGTKKNRLCDAKSATWEAAVEGGLASGVVFDLFADEVGLLRGRQWIDAVENEEIAIRIVEGWKAGHGLERIETLDIGQGAGIDIVPCGVP